jgi:hypothetical protein
VVKEMPMDRAPDPDGFNEFKNVRKIIKHNFIRWVNDFYSSCINLKASTLHS